MYLNLPGTAKIAQEVMDKSLTEVNLNRDGQYVAGGYPFSELTKDSYPMTQKLMGSSRSRTQLNQVESNIHRHQLTDNVGVVTMQDDLSRRNLSEPVLNIAAKHRSLYMTHSYNCFNSLYICCFAAQFRLFYLSSC